MDLNAMKTWLTLRSNALLCLIQAVIPGIPGKRVALLK